MRRYHPKMDIDIAPGNLPFRFAGNNYRIVRTGIKNDVAFAEVFPRDATLEAELMRRIQRDKALSVYYAHNYVCFPDQYEPSR